MQITLPPPDVETPARPRPVPRVGSGPPLPPLTWLGGGDGGSGWSWWQAFELLVFLLVLIGVLLRVLWLGAEAFPASVAVGLIGLAVYWIRNRPLQSERSGDLNSWPLLWGGVGGTAVSLLTHLAPPDNIMRNIEAIAGGGVVGYFAWLLGDVVVLFAICAWWLVLELRRPRG